MLSPEHLKALKKSAQREEWSSVGDTLITLYAEAVGDHVDVVRVKRLVPLVQEQNREDLCWAVDQLLRSQNRPDSN